MSAIGSGSLVAVRSGIRQESGAPGRLSRVDQLIARMALFERTFSENINRLEEETGNPITRRKFLFNPNKIDWNNFTAIIETSFDYLDLKDFYRASRVCKEWNHVGQSDKACKRLMQRFIPIAFTELASLQMPKVCWPLQIKYAVIKRNLPDKIDLCRELLDQKMIACEAALGLLPLTPLAIAIFI